MANTFIKGQIMIDKKSKETRLKIPWYKRRYLIDKEFQIKTALSIVGIGLVSSLSSVGLLLWTFWSFNIWQGQRLPKAVLIVLGCVVLFNVLTTYVFTIVASQRIAGPLYNLMNQFKRLGTGDFNSNAHFRSYDEIHDMAKAYNDMVTKLKERDDKIFAHVQKAYQETNHEDLKQLIKWREEMLNHVSNH